jgi:hypothetical protein
MYDFESDNADHTNPKSPDDKHGVHPEMQSSLPSTLQARVFSIHSRNSRIPIAYRDIDTEDHVKIEDTCTSPLPASSPPRNMSSPLPPYSSSPPAYCIETSPTNAPVTMIQDSDDLLRTDEMHKNAAQTAAIAHALRKEATVTLKPLSTQEPDLAFSIHSPAQDMSKSAGYGSLERSDSGGRWSSSPLMASPAANMTIDHHLVEVSMVGTWNAQLIFMYVAGCTLSTI